MSRVSNKIKVYAAMPFNIPVLEELEAQAVRRADLNALRSACGTGLSSDCVTVARLRSNGADLVLLRWSVVPAGLLVSGAAELGEDKAARSRVAERRGLQLRLLREEEDGAAALALVRLWDVEVEDGALLRL